MVISFIFYVGGLFITKLDVNFVDMFTVLMVLMFAAEALGLASAGAPDMGKAKAAAFHVFTTLDTPSKIDYKNCPGKVTEPIQGEIEFKDVVFKYPTRNKIILRKVSFKISKGQKVALVGQSGSGKSTSVQLLLRNYDPIEGKGNQFHSDSSRVFNFEMSRANPD